MHYDARPARNPQNQANFKGQISNDGLGAHQKVVHGDARSRMDAPAHTLAARLDGRFLCFRGFVGATPSMIEAQGIQMIFPRHQNRCYFRKRGLSLSLGC